MKITPPPVLIERYADNGEHSHWELLDSATNELLWADNPAAEYDFNKKLWKMARLITKKQIAASKIGEITGWPMIEEDWFDWLEEECKALKVIKEKTL